MNLRLQEQIDQLQEELSKAYNLIDQLQNDNKVTLENQHKLSKTLKESAMSKSAMLDQRTEENERLTNQLQINQITINSLTEQVQQLNERIKQQIDEGQFYKDEYLRQYALHSQETKTLKQQLHNTETKLLENMDTVKVLQHKINQLNIQIDAQRKQNEDQAIELYNLQKQMQVVHMEKNIQTDSIADDVFTKEQLSDFEAQYLDEIDELSAKLSAQLNIAEQSYESYEQYKNRYLELSIGYDEALQQLTKLSQLLKESDERKLKQIIIEYNKQMVELQEVNTRLILQQTMLKEQLEQQKNFLSQSRPARSIGLQEKKTVTFQFNNDSDGTFDFDKLLTVVQANNPRQEEE